MSSAKSNPKRARLKHVFSTARMWNRTAVDYANQNGRSALQEACVPLLASSNAISSSLEVILQEGHLFTAELILRPLIERVGYLLYIIENGDKAIAGLNEGNRPHFKTLMAYVFDSIDDTVGEASGLQFCTVTARRLNALVHADPIASIRLLEPHAGSFLMITGPTLGNPERLDELCDLSLITMIKLIGATQDLFPDANWSVPASEALASPTLVI